MKPSELYKKIAGFGLEDLAAAVVAVALQHGAEKALMVLQSAMRVGETGEWDEETERALLHQGQHATLKLFNLEKGQL